MTQMAMTKVLFERSGPRRSCTITAPIAGMPAELATAWSTWLAQHGVDPADVIAGWPVVCDDRARTVEWTAYVKNDNGRVLLTEDGEDFRRETHLVQLRAPALPMPDEPNLAR